jgi:hypothetical protein
MKTSVKGFVEDCDVCKQAKMEGVPYPGLLQPLVMCVNKLRWKEYPTLVYCSRYLYQKVFGRT